MIDPALANPANKFSNTAEVANKIRKAVALAERFHSTLLGDYYHPNSYAFYTDDPDHLSFSTVSWHAVRQRRRPKNTCSLQARSLAAFLKPVAAR
jgi:hypothetical protein